MRYVFILFALLLISCATPDYQVPSIDQAVVAKERKAAIKDAMQTALTRRGRVYDLAWPVLTENAELCEKARPTIGVVLADREMLARLAGGLREQELIEIGVPDHLILAHVSKGSPADAAGISSGTQLLGVEGHKVKTISEAADKIRERTADNKPVILTVASEAGEEDITITPIERCDYAVKISTSQSINAHAATGDIVIYTGVIRSLGDEALSYLIAHEMAHLVAGHRPKYVRNSLVSGAVLAGPPLVFFSGLIDRANGFRENPPDIPLTHRTIRFLAPWAEEFEAEADYLGLYLFARAGGDLGKAAELFEVFSRETPNAIYIRSSHPLTPERLAQLEASRREIEAKQASGEALMPERMKK